MAGGRWGAGRAGNVPKARRWEVSRGSDRRAAAAEAARDSGDAVSGAGGAVVMVTTARALAGDADSLRLVELSGARWMKPQTSPRLCWAEHRLRSPQPQHHQNAPGESATHDLRILDTRFYQRSPVQSSQLAIHAPSGPGMLTRILKRPAPTRRALVTTTMGV